MTESMPRKHAGKLSCLLAFSLMAVILHCCGGGGGGGTTVTNNPRTGTYDVGIQVTSCDCPTVVDTGENIVSWAQAGDTGNMIVSIVASETNYTATIITAPGSDIHIFEEGVQFTATLNGDNWSATFDHEQSDTYCKLDRTIIASGTLTEAGGFTGTWTIGYNASNVTVGSCPVNGMTCTQASTITGIKR